MERRRFLKRVGMAAGAAAVTLPLPALAQGKRDLRMVTAWSKDLPGLSAAAFRVAKRITDMTDGQLNVRVFSAGELYPALESFDAVSSGDVDFYHGIEAYWQHKSPAFHFFAAVPFGLTADEMNAWVHHGGAQAMWDGLSKTFGIKPFLCGNTGSQMGGWFNKEISKSDDFQGLRMRMGGLGAEVMRHLGVATVNLPGSEILPAFQSGAIDATEWFGPWNDMAFGLHKVAKFYYYPGFHEPGTSLSLGMNLKLWESLSPSQKHIVETATIAENAYSLAEFNAGNADALETLRTVHKVLVRKYDDATLQQIGKVSGDVVAAAGNTDGTARKIYDSFMAFRRKSMSWMKMSEQAYLDSRLLPFKYGN